MTGRSRRTAAFTPQLRKWFLTLVGAAIGLTLGPALATVGPSAAAQSPTDESTGPTIQLVEQTTFVAADGTLEFTVTVDLPSGSIDPAGGESTGDESDETLSADPASGLVLSVTFFGRLSDEDLVGAAPTTPLNRLASVPLDGATRTATGDIKLTIPVRSAERFDEQDRVLLPEPGVYPVTIELRDAEGPRATVRTNVVRLPTETVDERPAVEVAVVLWVSTAEGLSLDQAIGLLATHPSVPMTVVLDPGVMNQLRSDRDRAADLAAALGSRSIVAAPTVDLDPSALAEVGLDRLYAEAVANDRQSLTDLGFVPDEQIAVLGAPLTIGGARLLADLGIGVVLDDEGSRPGRASIGSGADRIDVFGPESDLNQALGGSRSTTTQAGRQRANRIQARLALRQQDEGPVLLGGPAAGVDPAPAIDLFLRTLSQPGGPQPVPLTGADGAGRPIRLAEGPAQDLVPVSELVDSLQTRLATFESFQGSAADDYQQRIVAALVRHRNPEDRVRALQLVSAQLDAELAVIVVHQPQPVTLAARSAPIPLVLDNHADGPRQVLLRFRSDRVTSPDDGRLVTIEPGTSSVDVAVVARSLGVSPLEVSVWTPDESVELASAQFEIRSTAVPGLGLLVSLSALALLIAWWVVDHRKRQRGDRDHPPAGETAGLKRSTV